MRRIFVSDCEGPISKNNNALEVADHFIPNGDKVFDNLERYDCTHGNFSKRRDYAAGNTSKLILPFLLAYDVTNKDLEEFCATHLTLGKNSKEALCYTQKVSDAFIVTTCYEQYVRALCKQLELPIENTYCMRVNLEQFELKSKDKSKIRSLAQEIAGLPQIDVPINAKSPKDLSSNDQAIIERIDKIFWNEIAKTNCKHMLSDINISGQIEKVNSIRDITSKLSVPLQDVMFVGDDLMDSLAMKYVRDGGGLAVSFNGDAAAVINADIAILSNDCIVISVIADLFLRFGIVEATNIAGNFDKGYLWRSKADPTLLDHLFELYPTAWPKVYTVSEWNVGSIIKESEIFRNVENQTSNDSVGALS